MSTINQGYFDRVRYILQNENLGSQIISEPIGWNDDEKELSRHKDYHGIFAKFSNNLKFQGDGYDFIKTIYDVYGINAIVRLLKDEKHPQTDHWTRSYDGYLDLSTYQNEEKTISLKFNSGGLEAELKARESEAVEITRNTTLDLLPLEEISIKTVELDGRRIFLKTKLEAFNTGNYVGHFSRAGDYGSESSGIPFSIVNKSHEHAHAILEGTEVHQGDSEGTYNGDPGMMFFAISDKERTIRVKLDMNFKFESNMNREDWAAYQINLTRYTGPDYSVVERINLFNLPNESDIANANGNIFSIAPFDAFIVVGIGESLSLESRLRFNLKNVNAGQNTARIECWLKNVNGTLTLEEDSFFEKSNAKCLLPHETAERLIEIYTNKKALKSNILGRTDIGYSTDGKASLIGLSHGFWIRGFDNSDEVFKPLTTSLKDFIDSFSATHNIGLGVENDGFKEFVRIEELGYFYNRNTTIKLPFQVKKVKRSIATDYYYSSLEFGYEKGGDYEEACGLDEYNGSSKFTTIIKAIKNTYSKLSKYRSDSYGLEFARRKPKSLNDTEDTRYDTDVFLFDMKRDAITGLKLRKWEDDFQQAPTGTFSPETAYNLRLSPFNCLLRHGWVIAAGLTKYVSDFIVYTKSTANSSLSTKLIGRNQYAENGNIINSELGRSKYVPEFIEFEHEVNFEINQLLQGSKVVLGKKIPNIYGCIEFINENGETEKGFLINLKPNKQGQWKLLKAN